MDPTTAELQDILAGLLGETPTTSATYIPPGQLKPGEVTAQDAAARVNAMYAGLQEQMRWIIKTYGGKNKIIPCNVRQAYNQAVKAFQALATNVFDQALKQGYQPVQQVRNADGTLVAEYKDGIVRVPGTFEECTAGLGRFGLAPLIPGIVATVPAITQWIILFLAAAGAAAAVAFMWPTDYEKAFNAAYQRVELLKGCVDGKVQAGMAMPAASTECGIEVPKVGDSGLGFWGTVGVAAVLIGGGALLGYIIWRKTSAVERARREGVEAAKDEARQLRAEARRLVSAARVPGVTRTRSRYSASPSMPSSPTAYGEEETTDMMGRPMHFKGCFCT